MNKTGLVFSDKAFINKESNNLFHWRHKHLARAFMEHWNNPLKEEVICLLTQKRTYYICLILFSFYQENVAPTKRKNSVVSFKNVNMSSKKETIIVLQYNISWNHKSNFLLGMYLESFSTYARCSTNVIVCIASAILFRNSWGRKNNRCLKIWHKFASDDDF